MISMICSKLPLASFLKEPGRKILEKKKSEAITEGRNKWLGIAQRNTSVLSSATDHVIKVTEGLLYSLLDIKPILKIEDVH